MNVDWFSLFGIFYDLLIFFYICNHSRPEIIHNSLNNENISCKNIIKPYSTKVMKVRTLKGFLIAN